MLLTAAAVAFLSTCAPDINTATIAGIIQKESGWHTYAIADYSTHPATSYYPSDIQNAVRIVRSLHEAGHHVSAGLAQVNDNNWTRTGLNDVSVFQPCRNVNAGDRILYADYQRALKTENAGDPALKRALQSYSGDSSDTYSNQVISFARGYQTDIPLTIVVTGNSVDAVPASAPVNGSISSNFGWRERPFAEFHAGLDIAAEYGTPVYATAAGIVTRAAMTGGFGNKIEIDHRNGYATWFGHLSEIDVHAGETVQRGQFIGRVGSTGLSTGPHLHYQVMQNGKPIDPRAFLGGTATVTTALPLRRTIASRQAIVSRNQDDTSPTSTLTATLPVRHHTEIATSAVVQWALPQKSTSSQMTASATSLAVRKRIR